jgi:IS30 family transposase
MADLIADQTCFILQFQIDPTGREAANCGATGIPKELYKSLTWDRGKELTDHRRFTLATTIDVYFCDPQSP